LSKIDALNFHSAAITASRHPASGLAEALNPRRPLLSRFSAAVRASRHGEVVAQLATLGPSSLY